MTRSIAAGGLLWRDGETLPELALVFRKQYSDWTLPKGKPEAEETLGTTARREVKEETGVTARRGRLVGTLRYEHEGREKTVVFWHMRSTEAPLAELADDVSEVIWMTQEEAAERLTHEGQKELVRRAGEGSQVTRWKAPERLRLLSDIEVARTRIGKTLATSSSAAEWASEATNMLASAEAEARSGDLDNGWKYLHEAYRQELFGLDLETLAAKKETLGREAEKKLAGWRKEAVGKLLAELDNVGASAPVERWRTLMYEAQKTRDEHSDNVYFRNRLLRKQMSSISVVLAGLVIGFITLLLFDVGTKGFPGNKLSVGPIVLAMFLGGMAACLSALITFATSTTQVSIPTHLANVSITLTRPLIGAVSGAAALLMLKSGMITVTDGAVPWIFPFVFGFSERAVIGALKPKE